MLTVEIMETGEGVRNLAAAWRALALRVPSCLFTQTYDWCLAGWQHCAQPGDLLKCVTVWHGTELVGVWPFYQRRTIGIRRLDLLGSGLGDYADPLLDPAYDTPAVCELVLNALSENGDVLDLNFLAAGSNMQAAVAQLKHVRRRWRFEDFTIDPRAAQSWDMFMSRYSKNMRNHLRSAQRKLGERGAVTFEMAKDADRQAEIIAWTLQKKQDWLQRNNLKNDWYYKATSQRFLTDLANRPHTGYYLAVFSLRVDGAIIATDICGVGSEEITGLITTFDPTYHSYSPGMLIVQAVAHWAFDRELVFGLMVNRALEKERWANRVTAREAYQIALTLPGLAFIIPRTVSEFGLWLRKVIVGRGLKVIFSPSKIKYLRALLGRLKRPVVGQRT
jgi:CelD/BcsL family acetyltransferase involved in cellulose biosynthesis